MYKCVLDVYRDVNMCRHVWTCMSISKHHTYDEKREKSNATHQNAHKTMPYNALQIDSSPQ